MPRLLRRLRCRFGSHARIQNVRIRGSDGQWRSRCRHCNRPMIRLRSTRWVLDKGGLPAPIAQNRA